MENNISSLLGCLLTRAREEAGKEFEANVERVQDVFDAFTVTVVGFAAKIAEWYDNVWDTWEEEDEELADTGCDLCDGRGEVEAWIITQHNPDVFRPANVPCPECSTATLHVIKE